jgi:hypothetical protein
MLRRLAASVVMVNGVVFPRRLPAQILAMAKPARRRRRRLLRELGAAIVRAHHRRRRQGRGRSRRGSSRSAKAEAAIQVAHHRRRSRRAGALTRADGVRGARRRGAGAAGTAAERERLKAIDELPVAGCEDLVAQAKYGQAPLAAQDLAVQILKAERSAGAAILSRRRAEGTALTGVKSENPGGADRVTAETNAAHTIAAHMNGRRGGVR